VDQSGHILPWAFNLGCVGTLLQQQYLAASAILESEMGQALYRKYRSKSLDEIVGQEHIITALKTALKKGHLSHAYLFTGPRGVGKTSIARILAHDINNLQYTDENAHIDIIEIDAASNRGIDEIRDLREKVYIAPTSGKYKIYIIDEVHMLTPQAFNALLKTLEEPPAHVVFILATTEAHKLPATIISRTQRYTFRPADTTQLIAHLASIADQEKISISNEALALIAEHGDGSFRDSVGLLDQIGSGRTKVTEQDVQELLGLPPKGAIDALITQLAGGQIHALTNSLQALYSQGFPAATIAKQLGNTLRTTLLEGTSLLGANDALELAKKLLEVPVSHDPGRFLELTLLSAVAPTAMPEPTASATPVTTPVSKPVKKQLPSPVHPAVTSPKEELKPQKEEPKPVGLTATATSKTSTGAMDPTEWPKVLGELKTQYNTLYSIVRMAEPQFEAGKITLTFSFAFHQKRLNEAKNKDILSNVVAKVSGAPVEIVCLFDKNVKPNPLGIAPANIPPESINTISSIFGGGEVIDG
jgi:DNA polymerase III subunit gamma/tau